MNIVVLDHPNIVKMKELYIDTDKGLFYLIMEYVKGKEMFKVLKKNGSYSGFFTFLFFTNFSVFFDFFQFFRVFGFKDLQADPQRDLLPSFARDLPQGFKAEQHPLHPRFSLISLLNDLLS